MNLHGKSIILRSKAYILKFLFCFVIEIFNLIYPIMLMQKSYLFPVQIGFSLANASKIYRIYRDSTLSDYWQCSQDNVAGYWQAGYLSQKRLGK
jgi:hypothetical protein